MGAGAGVRGCHACVKYVLFAFNFLFWLIGCALVGLGIWVLVDEGFKKLSADSSFEPLQYAGIALIVIGAIVMFIGFFGCCGAIRESPCLLSMFFVCLLLLFIALLGAGIYCFVKKESFIEFLSEDYKQQVSSYESTPDEKMRGYVDLVQTVFKCCGAENPSEEYRTIPESCQSESEDAAPVQPRPGCVRVLSEQLNQYSVLLGGIALGGGFMMLLGMVFSLVLCCAIRDLDK